MTDAVIPWADGTAIAVAYSLAALTALAVLAAGYVLDRVLVGPPPIDAARQERNDKLLGLADVIAYAFNRPYAWVHTATLRLGEQGYKIVRRKPGGRTGHRRHAVSAPTVSKALDNAQSTLDMLRRADENATKVLAHALETKGVLDTDAMLALAFAAAGIRQSIDALRGGETV
jgi:hypothetical protein